MDRKVTIGNAWHDENGKSSGGMAGDQLQTNIHDYKGEVRQQAFYKSSKGWMVIRAKSRKLAKKLAKLMIKACDNANIGYSQSDRYGIISAGIKTKKPVNCDCSSLVRECIHEASGKEIPDFNTTVEVSVLERTGLFEPAFEYKDAETTLYTGDIIVTRSKGHTAIVTEGEPLSNPYPEPVYAVTSKAIAIKEGLEKYIYEGDTVRWVQYQLCKAGYQSTIDLYGGMDGLCGEGTVKCIKEFQREKNLEVNGVCDRKTRRKLAKI